MPIKRGYDYMSFTFLFRLHAILAIPYALGLLLIPRKIVNYFTKKSLLAPGAAITRLFGASLLFIALTTWESSFLNNVETQRMVARNLFIYTSIGFISLLFSQMSGHWNRWGWLNILSYLIFVIGYGYLLWL